MHARCSCQRRATPGWRRFIPTAIITTPVTESTAPNAKSATASEADETAVLVERWLATRARAGEGGGLAVEDEAPPADTGSATVTVVGLLPFVGSTATVTQAPGVYVGATWYPSAAPVSSTQWVVGLSAAIAVPVVSVVTVATTGPEEEPRWRSNVKPGVVTV